MSYSVAIRDNATGEIRVGQYDYEWHEASLFWWQEGNMACDCNRHLEFLRAGGPGPASDPHWNNADRDCGEDAYSVLYADLPDGSRVQVDSGTVVWPMVVYDEAKGPDRQSVSIWEGGNIKFVWELQPGETWTPHPAGGVIIAHPDRRPLRLWFDAHGAYRQDWVELSESKGGNHSVD